VSNEIHDIPRHGNAGVAFLGVELRDATIVIASVFVGLAAGARLGTLWYIGVPVAGYFLNKLYIDWRSNALPGQLRQTLFEQGLIGYGRAFRGADVVFLGDSRVINPQSRELLDDMSAKRAVRAVPPPNIAESCRGNQGA
jgi:hypothetical protein